MKAFPLQFPLLSSSTLLAVLVALPATAQIIPDNTTNTLATPQGNIIEINGGIRATGNLFHSFNQFSVPAGDTAFFNNALDIGNIFSRITGGSISQIDGIIQANGTANLFLINPNGIVFGPDAFLDIGGSFLATTADSINFADDTQFSATNSQTQPIMTVSAPIGLGFGARPGSIVGEFVALEVLPGETLALVGGDLSLEGVFLIAEEGRIELGSVAGNNFVKLTPTNPGLSLDYEESQNFQDISLSQESFVAVGGDRGGDIQIQGRRVILTEDSQVVSIALVEGQAGELKVTASESVELVGAGSVFPTGFFNEVEGEATGERGTLTIDTQQLIIKDGAQVSTTTFGKGQGVDLRVNASQSVEILGNTADGSLPSGLLARVTEGATGNGGTLTIATGNLTVKDGAQVSVSTFGEGRAGDLIVSTEKSIELIGRGAGNNEPSGLFAQVERGATGNGGNLTVETERLTVLGGAQISTAARNGGQAGNLEINASDFIRLSGTSPTATFKAGSSGIFISAEPAFTDDAGNLIITTADAGELNVTTGQLIVEDGARISADTLGIGNGGDATLNVRQLIIRNGGQIRAGSLVEDDAVNNIRGSGGILRVNAESIEVTGTGTIGSTPVKSALLTAAEGTGNGGQLILNTENLHIRDGAEVTANSSGPGTAGGIIINASGTLRATDGDITTSADQSAGGAIKITTEDIRLFGDSDITTSVSSGAGGGGDITITSGSVLAFDDSDILAFARDGRGGDITFNTPAFFGFRFTPAPKGTDPATLDGNQRVDINASGAVDGVIILPDVTFIQNSLNELPENLIDPDTLLANSCIVRSADSGGNFIITGPGGLPLRPGDATDSPYSTGTVLPVPSDNGQNNSSNSVTNPPWQIGDPIVEPTGVYRLPNGELVMSRECP
ncbi:MAG: filamentous hemagglutinin N-terminal domain-containing protein [Symploca sp. SIO2C1]|nr:filamentous hemagglutinin N-terminal domain-containing protein [Symploca sp. SIO2C1]